MAMALSLNDYSVWQAHNISACTAHCRLLHAKMIRTVRICHLYLAVLNFTHIGIPNLDHLILRQ